MAGKYSFMVSDDYSGHIPTLIMRNVIDHINQKAARPSISTIFIKGKSILDDSERQRLLDFLPNTEDTRGLIVTEFMSRGESVRSIGRVIHEARLSYDVVTPARVLWTPSYRTAGALEKDEEIFPRDKYGSHTFYPGEPKILAARDITNAAINFETSSKGNLVMSNIEAAAAKLIAVHKL